MEQDIFEIAKVSYAEVINTLDNLATEFKRRKNLGDEWKVDIFLRQFDIILQYSLLEVAVLDNKLKAQEIDFIKNLTQYGDFVEYIKAAYNTDFEWDYFVDANPESVNEMLKNEEEPVVKCAQDFVGIVSAFNAITDDIDYPNDLARLVVRICAGLVFSDDDTSETPEAVSKCLIFNLINMIKERTATMAKGVDKAPERDEPKEEELSPSGVPISAIMPGRKVIEEPKEKEDDDCSTLESIFLKKNELNEDSPFHCSFAKGRKMGLIYIEVDNKSSGSGFVITKNGYAITCSHVVHNGKKIFVMVETDKGRDVFKASVIYENIEHDVALIKIDADYDLYFYEVETDYSHIETGEDIALYGYPFGKAINSNVLKLQPSMSKGIISSENAIGELPCFYIDINAMPGHSGGPIFHLPTGRVIGHLCGSYGSDRANLVYMRSLEFIISLLK